MRLRGGVTWRTGREEDNDKEQREKCVTNVETTPENDTVGVNGREAGLILMFIRHPHYTPPLNVPGLAVA